MTREKMETTNFCFFNPQLANRREIVLHVLKMPTTIFKMGFYLFLCCYAPMQLCKNEFAAGFYTMPSKQTAINFLY